MVARFRGDAVDALHRMRRLLALERARGGNPSVALGNLIERRDEVGADCSGRGGVAHGQFVVAALGDDAFGRVHAEGAQLRDAEIAALAFGRGDD